MFNKDRYITIGVNESIEIELQRLLWNMIDTIEVEKDYLQIFDIIPVNNKTTKIVHRQEVPEYRKEYKIEHKIDNALKVFIIDSIDHSTMMCMEEY